MVASLVLASDREAADVGTSLLGRGNAVDAVAGVVFAAAGLHAGVLLGPAQLLLGGAGAGLRAVDGRNRQPGLGNPRPRGFRPGDTVPPAARVGVPGLPAALLAAVTTYGKLSVAGVIGPAAELARGRAPLRAGVLARIGQRGPAALSEALLADELVASAGRLAGGLLSVRDLDELRPAVSAARATRMAAGAREILTVPWGSEPAAEEAEPGVSAEKTRVVVAVDRNGLVAVACYAVTGGTDGLLIEALDVVAPFTAAPVRRGQTRVTPGEIRPAAAPIALATAGGLLDLVVGVGSAEDGERVLRQWLSDYRPVSDLEREAPPPAGLLAAQRSGAGWATVIGE